MISTRYPCDIKGIEVQLRQLDADHEARLKELGYNFYIKINGLSNSLNGVAGMLVGQTGLVATLVKLL